MISNLHTHTWRCNHAFDREEEYVSCAVERGLDTLGFSDHTPYFFPGDYYSHFRMRPEQLTDYCDTVLELRKKYGDKISLPLGLEAEYYPAYFSKLLAFLRDSPIEYLILGQHFVGNEIGDHYSGNSTSDERKLAQYCAQSADAMQTGLFTYFAHPDLLHFTVSEQIYRKHMKLICREAKNCGLPLEINLLGLRQGRHYPNPVFWELAAEEGCTVVLGCDAHESRHLLETKTEQQAMKMIKDFGLHLAERVAPKHI